jgi:hypothetical protein
VTVDLDAIEKAARYATAPPWRESPGGIYGAVVADDLEDEMDDDSRKAYGGYPIGESMRKRDRTYFLAVQPDVVLELVAMARRAPAS